MNFYQDKKYIINLETRPDRLESILAEMSRLGVSNYEIFPAIPTGAAGCLASHLAIIKKAQQENLPHVIILEDDCEFIKDFDSELPGYMRELPDNWDMLYFGAHNKMKLMMVSSKIGQCVHTLTTSCYGVKNTAYDRIIDELSRGGMPVDEIYRDRVHPFIYAYCVKPALIYQRTGYSDIEGKVIDYKGLFDDSMYG